MRRRDFICLVGSAGAWPLAAHAQQTTSTRVLGVLMGPSANDPGVQSQLAAFRDALTKLRWVEGSNLQTELRWGRGDTTKIGLLAKELVGLRPDVILGHTTRAIAALARETHTIPIVFPMVVDPVGSGFVASLSHPGGNITGFQSYDPEIGGKWFELLKEIAPRTERVAALFNPATAVSVQLLFSSIQAAASSVGVQASCSVSRHRGARHHCRRTSTKSRCWAHCASGSVVSRKPRKSRSARFAGSALPSSRTIYWSPDFVAAGGLITYAIDFTDLFRKAAGYVDRILKGAKACRSANPATDHVPIADQPQDGNSARPHRAADTAGQRRQGDRISAAKLAVILAGESPANRGCPVAVVVISSNGKGDRPVESLEVKAPGGQPEYRSDPYRGASNLAGRSECAN